MSVLVISGASPTSCYIAAAAAQQAFPKATMTIQTKGFILQSITITLGSLMEGSNLL